MNDDPELLKIETKDVEIKDLNNKTGKHDHEKILKSFKIDNEYHTKKYRSLKKKNVLLIITEILIGWGTTITTSTISIINPSIGILLTSSTDLLTSIAVLITNEYKSKLKLRYTKLQDWIIVVSLLYEKRLKQSMIDKKSDERETQELKKIYIHYLDKTKGIMKNTWLKVEVVFSDILSKVLFLQNK